MTACQIFKGFLTMQISLYNVQFDIVKLLETPILKIMIWNYSIKSWTYFTFYKVFFCLFKSVQFVCFFSIFIIYSSLKFVKLKNFLFFFTLALRTPGFGFSPKIGSCSCLGSGPGSGPGLGLVLIQVLVQVMVLILVLGLVPVMINIKFMEQLFS